MKVRTEARRVAIVEVATELFKECGYERASMNELAKRLGGSKATLYGYFPSKEALFDAVARRSAMPHLTEATLELRATPETRARLESILMSFAEKLLNVTVNDSGAIAVYRMVIAEAGRSEVGELFHGAGPTESMAALARWMKAAMDRGHLRKVDPKIFALQFTSLVTAEVQIRLYQRNPPAVSPAAIRQMAKRALELFLSGAAAR
jgi:AcrR family transcriptional regulator